MPPVGAREALTAGVVMLALGGAPAALAAPPSGLPSGIPPAAKRAEPALPAPAAWPFDEGFPRTSGTGRLQRGALLWTDFVYDDHGADGVGQSSSPSSLAASDGTYSYPEGPAAGNGADLFRIGIGLTDRATWWRIDWTTLVDPSVPIAAFALDTDADASTGVADWPGVPGLRSPGIERVLLVSSRGAWLLGANGDRVEAGRLSVDRAARSFVVRVPRRALAPRGTWRVRAASGLADAEGDGFSPVGLSLGATPGQPPVYNLGFRSHDQEPQKANFWMEDAQAAALAAGDATPFSQTVRWRALAGRQTTEEPLPSGWLNRWYVTSLELGQGVIQDSEASGDDRPNFLGRIQPYGMYVPAGDPRQPSRLVWLLHSLSVQHNQYAALNPNLVRDVCERERTVCATTLGRGPDGWYVDEAELDFFEVWGAVARTVRLDPERTVIGGYSMGGFAAYRLGLGYPDLFSQAVSLAGPPAKGVRGAREAGFADVDTTALVENARWLPYLIAHGAADELVPVTSVVEQVQEFERLGYRYRFELYPAKDHMVWAAEDGFTTVAPWIERTPRMRDPGHVTFAWYPALSHPRWGTGPTGAYWVRRLAARSGELARVDARSSARPDPAVTGVTSREPIVGPGGSGEPGGAGAILGEPGDQVGFLEAVTGADPSVGVRAERRWEVGERPARSPRIELSLENVARLALQTRRAGRRRSEGLTVPVASDGPVLLTLLELVRGQRVLLDGAPVGAAGPRGAATVALPAGAHLVSVAAPLARGER
jgi:Putative esterase